MLRVPPLNPAIPACSTSRERPEISRPRAVGISRRGRASSKVASLPARRGGPTWYDYRGPPAYQSPSSLANYSPQLYSYTPDAGGAPPRDSGAGFDSGSSGGGGSGGPGGGGGSGGDSSSGPGWTPSLPVLIAACVAYTSAVAAAGIWWTDSEAHKRDAAHFALGCGGKAFAGWALCSFLGLDSLGTVIAVGTCAGLAIVLGVNWGRTHESEYHSLAGASGLVSMVIASYLVG